MAIKIGLDAGHGLKTAGKQTPDRIKEFTLNDKVADKATAILKDYDVEIIRTDNNEGNVDEPVSSRLKKYMDAGVSVFVSIHHNAYTGKWNNATGVEVYTDNNPTTKDTKLAKCIYDRLVKYTGLKGRGIKKTDFYVINQDKIPAVLVEGGFMDGTNDYKVITSEAGQNAYAKAVAEGLIEFLGLKKKVVITPKPETAKPTTTTTSTSTTTKNIKKNDLVKIASGASYYNSKKVPAWIQKQNWYVESVSGDRAVINKNEKGTNKINSPINVKYLTVVKSAEKPASTSTTTVTTTTTKKEIKVGSSVKIVNGAKTYTGGKLASFVYKRTYKVKEIKGDRVVITYLGVVVAAVKKSDLIFVK